MQKQYGIDVKLTIRGQAEGRWLEPKLSTIETSYISHLAEFQIAKFKLDNVDQISKNWSIQNDFENLPEEYDESQYRSFISTWGTHFIYEVAVGGSLQMNCLMPKSQVSGEKLKCVKDKVSAALDALLAEESKENYSTALRELRTLGVSSVGIETIGGNFPAILSAQNPDLTKIMV